MKNRNRESLPKFFFEKENKVNFGKPFKMIKRSGIGLRKSK